LRMRKKKLQRNHILTVLNGEKLKQQRIKGF